MDIIKIKKKVKEKHGDTAHQHFSTCLNSLFERLEFARYHFYEAKYAITSYQDDSITDDQIFDLVLSKDAENQDQYEYDRLRARANITAFIQSLHSVSDILSHVIYYGLNLNNAKSKEHIISLKNIMNWTQGSHQELYDLLAILTNHDDYQYLEALNNHSKHRSIISTGIIFSLTGKPHEVKLPSFSHKHEHYEERLAYPILSSEFNRQGKLFFKIIKKLDMTIQH